MWRIHWEEPDEILTRSPSKPTRYRFDDPRSEYAVTYGNAEEAGAFLEVYGDTQRLDAAQRDRWRTVIDSGRDLLLIDLDEARTQKAFRLDARIAASRQYATTQRWSRAFHDWYPDVDAIRYRSRHESATLNFCLFLDRCGDALSGSASERLGEIDRRTLLRPIAPYRIVVDW
jgi:RES domain